MIYLGNGLYSDSGNSLMHAGNRRNLGIDWNNPAQVREYYKEYYAMRNKGNGRIPSYNVPQANRAAAIGNAARNASNTASNLLKGIQVARTEARTDRNGNKYYIRDKEVVNGLTLDVLKRPTAHNFSELRRENGIPLARRPGGKVVTSRSPSGGFVAPRHNADKIAAGKNVADTASKVTGGAGKLGKLAYATYTATQQNRDYDDKKRSPKGGPHFATKEYQQEQLNKRLHKDSQKAENKAYHDQIARQQGTLYEAVAGGGLMRRRNINGPYESKEAMKEAARMTTNSAQPGVEAGRKRVAEQQRKQREYENGVKAGRERARNAKNAKNGVESKSAHNQAVKGQENRGSGTLADFNYQKKMDNNEKRKVADYKRGNKNSYFDLDLGKHNTERGIAAGRNRAKIKQAEDAFNKKLAADKQAKKDKQRKTASMPYEAFKEGSERIVGSAYDAYKKGKKKLKKFFG